MVHTANKENYSLINCIAIAEKVSLEEVDWPSPHSYFSLEDDNDIRDIGKHDSCSVVLQSPYVT